MAWTEDQRAELESRLAAAVPAAETEPKTLHRAIRYSLLGGGKRLRPLLVRAAALAVAGRDCAAAWAPAVAVECIHAYSLIHDDLPALDDDDLRRGRPSCHKVFGEAVAILAGDALQTLAFARLADTGSAAMVAELARAIGTPAGMVAGQVMDLEAVRGTAGLNQVEKIHRAKTAALIRACAVLGGIAAGANPGQIEQLGSFGATVGLAFQIRDDLLDISSTSAQLGKTAGKDEAQRKLTYPAVAGLEAARARATALRAEALAELAPWNASADPLRALAHPL
ncbi:MAG TPA: farnesyl diphosphate synthase [Terriglobales bacterium]|nr:farnesyl diphosphate synthase [Terriglobales bacterium]